MTDAMTRIAHNHALRCCCPYSAHLADTPCRACPEHGNHRMRDPLSETLARIGRDMAQQRMAYEYHKRLGLDDPHHYREYHRFDQGRWAFYESARLICQYFGHDFDEWLKEWGPEGS